MKIPVFITALAFSGSLLPAAPVGAAEQVSLEQQLQQQIPKRVLAMDLPFTVHYTSRVQHEISRYLNSGRRPAAYMLGRARMYFPIFDYYLEAHRLPKMLRYIPLLESRLQPSAESPAGAAGLWQFMPGTGKAYGLAINEWVDERKHPCRATDAAVRYLRHLHGQFEDWSLALAAYNCGPGRVRQAMRETGCRKFWDLQHELPRQTQAYIPRLIAAMYVAEQYEEHRITPRFRSYYKQSFSVFRIQHDLDLAAIAQHCGMKLSRLLSWNPGYAMPFVPEGAKPYYLILPETALPSFRKYIIKESRRTGEDYAVAVLETHGKASVLGKT